MIVIPESNSTIRNYNRVIESDTLLIIIVFLKQLIKLLNYHYHYHNNNKNRNGNEITLYINK